MTEQRETADDDVCEQRKTLPPRSEVSAPARLVVLAGSNTGRRVPLEDTTIIGRDPDRVDLHVDDAMVSSMHARVERTPAGWRIVDLGSRNGTHVNGARVASALICFGDRLRVGHTLLLFSHHDALEEQLQSRQKYEAIGRLGATVAHDLNNLIGAVVASADHLRNQFAGSAPGAGVKDPGSCSESLDDIEAAMRRSADLVRRLLAFSKRAPRRNGAVEISRLCEDAVQMLRRSLPASVTMTVDVTGGCTVRGDSTLLHQMMLNLLVNARDATDRTGGTIHVQLREKNDARGDSATGSWVEIVVTDTGEGMSEATRKQMFEPFFTTKGPDRGTGLGLSIVMEAVAAHGGLIDCHSTPKVGTTFSVRLPATRRRAGRTTRDLGSSGSTVPPDAKPARILLVDDEPMVRRCVSRLLTACGHQVTEACDGSQAIDLATAAPDLDLVILDLEMPVMDGQQALIQLRRLFPELPIAVMTGDCDSMRREILYARGASDVLDKPIESAALRARIHALLARKKHAA